MRERKLAWPETPLTGIGVYQCDSLLTYLCTRIRVIWFEDDDALPRRSLRQEDPVDKAAAIFIVLMALSFALADCSNAEALTLTYAR